jgi:hypothetical protein
MKCRNCGAENNVLDKVCCQCQQSLSFLDKGYRRFQTDSAGLTQSLQEEDEIFTGKKPGWRAQDLAPGPAKQLFNIKTLSFDFGQNEESIRQIAAFVLSSPHVMNNMAYRRRAASLTFLYLDRIYVFNAFATDHPVDGIDADPPLIVILGGLVQAVRIAAIGLGNYRVRQTRESREKLVEIIRWIGSAIIQNQGEFHPDNARQAMEDLGLEALMDENGEIVRKARSYSAAICMGVIAHELGHITLAHTLNTSAEINYEISRNQEREADSFASSIASSSPFSDYIVEGAIFWWALMTWAESVLPSIGYQETTHPNSRERLMDYLRSNKDQAAAMGIDEIGIQEFMP